MSASKPNSTEPDETRYPPDDPYADIERQQQELLFAEQDQTLGSISGVVSNLRQQARYMGTEVAEQLNLISGLDSDVDHSQSRLDRAQRTMHRFLEQNASSKSSWCILLLTIVLVCLLILLIIS